MSKPVRWHSRVAKKVCRGSHCCKNKACEGMGICLPTCEACPHLGNLCHGDHDVSKCCSGRQFCHITCAKCPDLELSDEGKDRKYRLLNGYHLNCQGATSHPPCRDPDCQRRLWDEQHKEHSSATPDDGPTNKKEERVFCVASCTYCPTIFERTVEHLLPALSADPFTLTTAQSADDVISAIDLGGKFSISTAPKIGGHCLADIVTMPSREPGALPQTNRYLDLPIPSDCVGFVCCASWFVVDGSASMYLPQFDPDHSDHIFRFSSWRIPHKSYGSDYHNEWAVVDCASAERQAWLRRELSPLSTMERVAMEKKKGDAAGVADPPLLLRLNLSGFNGLQINHFRVVLFRRLPTALYYWLLHLQAICLKVAEVDGSPITLVKQLSSKSDDKDSAMLISVLSHFSFKAPIEVAVVMLSFLLGDIKDNTCVRRLVSNFIRSAPWCACSHSVFGPEGCSNDACRGKMFCVPSCTTCRDRILIGADMQRGLGARELCGLPFDDGEALREEEFLRRRGEM